MKKQGSSAKGEKVAKKSPAKATKKAPKKAGPRPAPRGKPTPTPAPAPAPEVVVPSRVSDPKALREFVVEAARLVRDDKCEDVAVLDVRAISQVTDYIIIASGTSERQMRSVLEHVRELGESRGFSAFRSSTDEKAAWLLCDFVDLVVHLFEPATRAHYDIEMLWGDAPRVEWERPDQLNRDRAGLSPRGK